jgi:hypothetical protein
MQASLDKTAATFYLTELTTRYGLDVMDGAEKSLLTEVLEQKRTYLLILYCTSSQIGIPVAWILDTSRR